MLLPNIQAEATTTALITAGNTNAGAYFDAQQYVGPLTFRRSVAHNTNALTGPSHVNVTNVAYSTDNVTFTLAANFDAIVNTSNVSNIGVSEKSFDSRLGRYWRTNVEVSGTNTNVGIVVAVTGQKQRV